MDSLARSPFCTSRLCGTLRLGDMTTLWNLVQTIWKNWNQITTAWLLVNITRFTISFWIWNMNTSNTQLIHLFIHLLIYLLRNVLLLKKVRETWPVLRPEQTAWEHKTTALHYMFSFFSCLSRFFLNCAFHCSPSLYENSSLLFYSPFYMRFCFFLI